MNPDSLKLDSALADSPPIADWALDDQPAILLVDDDPFMLAMNTYVLRTMGYLKVQAADGARAALRSIEKGSQVDVIVCDLNMPGMDGIELLQTLNASEFRGKVILLSGVGVRIMHTVQKLLDGSRLVILGSLEKPIDRAAMHALLDSWHPVQAAAQTARLSFDEADLRRALREKQWLLHYQPKVNLRTGLLSGVEALIRWQHPELGLVPPDSFISLLEEYQLIDELTDWVLSEAMSQLARWQSQGMRFRMAVNLSMDNLRVPGFSGRVAELARSAGVTPQHVMLEITESRLIAPLPPPLENLVRLRMLRFGLSIDDFGTGHSSLVQLRDVPFTELKVDRGFVCGARHNQIIRPILEGSIGLAKRMGMKSVAEGVETESDWHLLREIGCDLAQGWFIGRPMLAEKLPQWLDAWTARRALLVDR
jgi:EAL domain-containing protein (putative c-di-GMP-specific phosphodiesterase class I)/ActR/RegA family two-component response regulator